MAKRTIQEKILEPIEMLTNEIGAFIRAAQKTYTRERWAEIERIAASTMDTLQRDLDGQIGVAMVAMLLGAGSLMHSLTKEMRAEPPDSFAATLEMARAQHRVDKRAAGEEPADFDEEEEDEDA